MCCREIVQGDGVASDRTSTRPWSFNEDNDRCATAPRDVTRETFSSNPNRFAVVARAPTVAVAAAATREEDDEEDDDDDRLVTAIDCSVRWIDHRHCY